MAIPTLARTGACWPPKLSGRPSTSSSRTAISSASAGPETSSHKTANSSPPSRATVSVSRTAARSRGAKPTSSSSPARCPSVSLTPLKLSRSTNMTARAAGRRPRRDRASPRRSRKSRRFGSSVRGSWKERWRMALSAACRSTAPASRLASAERKLTSSGTKRRRSRPAASRTPKGRLRPRIGTASPLCRPSSSRAGWTRKRCSRARSSASTGASVARMKADALRSAAGKERFPANRPSGTPRAARARKSPAGSCSAISTKLTPSVRATASAASCIRPPTARSVRARAPNSATAACCASRAARRASASCRLVTSRIEET